MYAQMSRLSERNRHGTAEGRKPAATLSTIKKFRQTFNYHTKCYMLFYNNTVLGTRSFKKFVLIKKLYTNKPLAYFKKDN